MTGALDELPWLKALRPDERERAAHHFRPVEIAAGARLAFPASESPRMALVLDGSIVLTRAELSGLAPVKIRLGPGDRWGELALFAAIRSGVDVEAPAGARLAVLDEEGFRAIGAEFPVVWLAVAAQLSSELKWKNDLLREIEEIDTERASAGELDLFLENKRRRVARRRTGVARRAGRELLRKLVTDPGREPAFWILLGFVTAIAVSRTVVALILRLHLQQQLFNLHASGGANPTHTHHFTYGFALIVASGLLAFFPRTRRWLKTIACAFGFGLGLVFDEFALIWNLNPDYYQTLSYEAQAAILLLLVQVVWLRRFYAGLLERWVGTRGAAATDGGGSSTNGPRGGGAP